MSAPLTICEKLRAAKPHTNHHANSGLCHEAANTIEALYEALERLIRFARMTDRPLLDWVEAKDAADAALARARGEAPD